MAAIAVMPDVMKREFSVPFFFGGTSLLIAVGVALDTMGQLEAHLIMRHYEGFLKKGRIQGRWFNVGSGVLPVIVILLGMPGSGKGTQSKRLADKYGFKHLATGDIFRAEIAHKTSIGVKAQDYLKNGKLVPDSIVTSRWSPARSRPAASICSTGSRERSSRRRA